MKAKTHSKAVGYLAWFFGFPAGHRFYYGRPITGVLWLFTAGLFLVGWVVDVFLVPSMDEDADRRFVSGNVDYSVAWILLYLLGIFGAHRFYMGKVGTGILYLLTLGLLGFGWIYDICTLNSQISEQNRANASC